MTSMIERRSTPEPTDDAAPIRLATPVTSPPVDDGATPASVVAGKLLEVEEHLTQLLKDRSQCESELVKFRERAQMRQHERDSLDLLIAAHRRHVAAWRQVQVFVDSIGDDGPGATLAAALMPGRPQ